MTARELAYGLLTKAENSRQYSNIALDNALSKSDLSPIDKGLVSAIFYGVLERRLTLDYQISQLSSRKLEEIDISALIALRMGIYQIIYLDRIPAHAAINETVELCPKKLRGFTNAILRSFLREKKLFLPEKNDTVNYLSVRYSISVPLLKRFLLIFGEEDTVALLEALNQPQKTTVRANTLLTDRDSLLMNIPNSVPTKNSSSGIYVKGSVRELYGFNEGLFFVQDEASQICVEALGAKPDELIMDICACPGSKSFGAAIEMNNKGNIFAFDLHENKLSLVINNAKRLRIDIINTAKCDGREFLENFKEKADRIICDVPCSGFGVLAKKPELRYKDPNESSALPKIQSDILDNACRYLKKGGTLIYSTCTLFPEENEDNVQNFLSRHPDFSLVPWSVGSISADNGTITLLPHIHNTDGFFIAKLIRK